MVNVVGRDESATKRITHRKCGAILEYTENEVRELWRGRDISGGADGGDGFTCPNCGGDVVVRSW